MINNHVPSYETCLKLKEDGFPQESLFYWNDGTHYKLEPFICTWNGDEAIAFYDFVSIGHSIDGMVAAPLLSEILEEITKIGFKGNLTYGHDGKWVTEDLVTEKYSTHQNVAESASLLWLKLNDKGKKYA